MSIITKVKKTGRLFQATSDLGQDKSRYQDANGMIQPETLYAGHLLDAYSYAKHARVVEYSRGEWGVFRGHELEGFVADLRLVHKD